MKRTLLALAALALSAQLALGQSTLNYIVPNAPAGANNNQAASTAFVQNAIPAPITLPLSLANGGLGGSQAAATANQVPVYPGTGGPAVPTALMALQTTVCSVLPSACTLFFGHADVRWYGAVCDGTTNDSTALAAAVAAAAGKTLRFPTGAICKGHLIVCSTNPCTVYSAIAGGNLPYAIELNGSTILGDSASYPAVYVETNSSALGFILRDGIVSGNKTAPYGLRVHGCNFCSFTNIQEGLSTAVGCAFEGTTGFGFYYNTVSNVNCGGNYATAFRLNTASFTGTIATTNLTTTSVTGTIQLGMGIGGTGVSVETFIVSQTSGTTGGAGVYVVNNSQSVGPISMVAQNYSNGSIGVEEYTMNGASPGCLTSLAYNASNTFINVSSQFNHDRGWDIQCAHNFHMGAEAEANGGAGIAITAVYGSSEWFGGYTEANGNSWSGAGVGSDSSFNNTDSSPGIKVIGGRHLGAFTNMTAAKRDIVMVDGVTGYGFATLGSFSGVTIP